jgi:hypothetical protein
MTFEASNYILNRGNLGLGVTPSSWGSNSFAFQTQGGAVWSFSSAYMDIWQNSYYNGTSSIYQTTAAASYYRQTGGSHQWFNAPSGSAGATVSWTQAMTLNASGNLSLGNTNDTYKLDVTGTGRFTGVVTIGNAVAGTNIDLILNGVSGKAQRIQFNNSGTNQWLIGAGAASETSAFEIYNANGQMSLSIAKATSAATFSSSVTASNNITVTGASTSVAPQFTMVQTGGNTYSAIGINRADGTGIAAGLASALVLRSGDATDSPIQFATANNVRMTIATGGNVGIGTTSPSAKLYVLGNSTTESIYYAEKSTASFSGSVITSLSYTASGTGWNHFIGYSDIGSTTNIKILGNGNIQNANNSYGAISDIKLKENITDATSKLDSLLKVKIRNYNLIGDDKKQLGVIAQELETIFPSMIEITNDVDKNGKYLGTTTKSVKYSVFVPMLIKAVQELKAELDTLKNK